MSHKRIDHIGNIELLNCSLLTIFSSAKCPASLILRAHDYAKKIRDGEIGVISGFHSPAEREVLKVLLNGKCPIVMVLGRSLKNARLSIKWKAEIEKGRLLVISPSKDYQECVTKEISLKCNDLAARIAKRVLIVHASEGGSLQDRVERWKSDGIKIEYLDRLMENKVNIAEEKA